MTEVTSVNGQTGAVVLTPADVEAVPESSVGVAGGVATLGGTGKLPEGQLPSSVGSSIRAEGPFTEASALAAMNAAGVGTLFEENSEGEIVGEWQKANA